MTLRKPIAATPAAVPVTCQEIQPIPAPWTNWALFVISCAAKKVRKAGKPRAVNP